MVGVVKMYQEDYKRWLEADLEDRKTTTSEL